MFGNFDILSKILTIPAILVGFTFHEYAHAIMADRLGDKTPRFQGRLTLNPMVHVELFGFIMIILAGFGWAKPVETNPRAYKNYYKDDLKVTIAGPIANLIVAVIAAILTGVFLRLMNYIPANNVNQIIYYILQYTIIININLFFFNLLPLPGLDGFHILRDLFPAKFYKIADQLYRYQMIILALFILTPISSILIGMPSHFLSSRLLGLAKIIAGF